MPKCDLLECYTDSDKNKLLQTANTFTALEVDEDIGDINFDEI